MALPRETKPTLTSPPTPEERQANNEMGIGVLGFFVVVRHFNPNPPNPNNHPAPQR
ncbi:MAG: hypothetical protein LCH30_09605 [Proteobacteria bacterium]|nr:hypothetical protein [Pseudomonadota bacterium]